MKSSSLFKWAVKKVCLPVVVVVLIISWTQSSYRYKDRVKDLEQNSYSLILKFNETESDVDELEDVTLFSASGKITYGNALGSHTEATANSSFKRALAGEYFVIKESNGKYTYWGPFHKNSGVISLTLEGKDSKLSLFVSIFLLNLLIALILVFCFCYLITNKISEGVSSLNNDLEDIQGEDFIKRESTFDNKEFSDLYLEINKLSAYFSAQLFNLRKQLKQWEVFFSTIPRGLLAIDSESKIFNCNQNALNLLNIKETTPLSTEAKSVMSVFRNADINRITADFLGSKEVLKEFEFKMLVNDIHESIKVLCVELDISAKPGVLMIMENVTSLRHLENMRKDFVSNVSHELKTPISIIGGFAETLKECLDDPQNALNFIKIIEKNSKRLNLIVDDLLNLSKLEQNEEDIRKDFERCDIRETIRSASELCSHEAEKKGVSIVLDLEDCKYYEQDTMLANHRLLEQAVRNLIENAIRYSPSDSEVSVASRKIKNEIEISVSDKGPGIPEEHQNKIFERFYRVDKSRDRQTGGSGLGLSIVKHILRVHKGNVILESRLGEGSCFKLVMPYNITSL